MKKLLVSLVLVSLLLLALGGAASAQPPTLKSLAPTVASTNSSRLRPVWAAPADQTKPSPSTIATASAPNDIDTPVTITGSGFAAVMDSTGMVVLTSPTASLGGTALTDVTFVDSSTLRHRRASRPPRNPYRAAQSRTVDHRPAASPPSFRVSSAQGGKTLPSTLRATQRHDDRKRTRIAA